MTEVANQFPNLSKRSQAAKRMRTMIIPSLDHRTDHTNH